MKALVTGGDGGLGRAMRARLEREGYEVESLDLTNGFDVTDPAAWERVEPVDLACLNAGILTAVTDLTKLSYDDYRQAVSVNVDGVVLGVRELAARLMPAGGSIVVTASLAGLDSAALDPVYALTKAGVVGFVRSVAPQLAAKGIRINAICPAFTDTPLVVDELRGLLPVPLIEPSFVAEAALRALDDEETGRAWVVQRGRIEPFRYPGVPGPR